MAGTVGNVTRESRGNRAAEGFPLQENLPVGITGNRAKDWPELAGIQPMVDRSYVRAHQRPLVDVPTLAVAVCTYAAWGFLTWYHAALPWWLLMPLGGYVVCLQGGLQHEAIHGYPFRKRLWNTLLVFPSLWLWLPYTHYRRTHLTHHRDYRLTCPVDDPESYYVTDSQWARMGWLHRTYRKAMNTLAGRLVLGPPYVAWRVMLELLDSIVVRNKAVLRDWALHLVSLTLVLGWVVGICKMPVGEYVFFFAFPGLALTLMRSFAEHQARSTISERTVVIESGPIMSLLYLNNNLHAMHHADPNAPWHKRPRQYRERRAELLAQNGNYAFRGYRELLQRYLFATKEPVSHPVGDL